MRLVFPTKNCLWSKVILNKPCELRSHEQCKDKLSKRGKKLQKHIDTKLESLRGNAFVGNPISRKKWPKEYRNLDNLYLLKIKNYRLLYTIIKKEEQLYATIHDFLTHTKYDRLFGYHS